MNIGCKVTLRGERMYVFLDKLFNIVLPRIRDFRGLSRKSFDGRGNYNMGLREQLVFPEINFDKVDKTRGMDIVIVTTAKTDEEATEFLTAMGLAAAKDVAAAELSNGEDRAHRAVQACQPKFAVRDHNRCRSAAVPAATCASSPCAASASARTRTAASFPA